MHGRRRLPIPLLAPSRHAPQFWWGENRSPALHVPEFQISRSRGSLCGGVWSLNVRTLQWKKHLQASARWPLASRSQQVQPSLSRKPIRWASARRPLGPACRVQLRRLRQPQVRRRAPRRIRHWRARHLSDPMCRKPIRWASARRHLAPACLAARARIESHKLSQGG